MSPNNACNFCLSGILVNGRHYLISAVPIQICCDWHNSGWPPFHLFPSLREIRRLCMKPLTTTAHVQEGIWVFIPQDFFRQQVVDTVIIPAVIVLYSLRPMVSDLISSVGVINSFYSPQLLMSYKGVLSSMYRWLSFLLVFHRQQPDRVNWCDLQ